MMKKVLNFLTESKKISDSYRHTQMYVPLYDFKTGELISEDDRRVYKIIRHSDIDGYQ